MNTNPTDDKYTKYTEDYTDLKDFFAGERKVKEKAERYTPRLEGHSGIDAKYNTYKEFGILYNALSRTRQGLKGAILRKPIDIKFPDGKLPTLDKIMRNGGSFNDLTRNTCDAVLGYGRFGVLVDIDEQEQPYIVTYDALSIQGWPLSRAKNTKQEILLAEAVEIVDPDDVAKMKTVEQLRKLELDGSGFYMVTIYRKESKENAGSESDWVPVESTKEVPNPRIPSYKGKRLDYIPFTFFGSSSNVPEPSRPPLLDLLNLLKGHWKLTVAYQYGLNFAGLPTPWFAGFDIEEGTKISLGPGAAYHTSEPTATAGFLMTEGKGLVEIAAGLDHLEKQMAVVGARLLEEQRPGVEAAETVRLRSSGDTATLSDIAGNIENGLTEVLVNIGFWIGVSEEQCNVGLNKDFVSSRLGPQDISALLAAVQAGQISEQTFIWNLQQGEVLQDGRTVEEEIEAIGEDRLKNQKNNVDMGFE